MTSSLRDWQRRCIDTALEHFLSTPHFFCQATPAAGKTCGFRSIVTGRFG